MSWFSRRKPKGEFPAAVGVTNGIHRSPGLGALADELDKRHVETILDFGSSFNENLTFLNRYCSNIAIRDLMGAGGKTAAPRASLARLDAAALSPAAGARYDVIILWDLLHYVERSRMKELAAALAALARRDALVLLIASGSTPIPLTPIKFRIRDRDHLLYEVTGERRSEAPRFTPREVEQLMEGFQPVRFFQLRNGLQEFLFRYEGPPEAPASREANLLRP